jgi:hypothetical protein
MKNYLNAHYSQKGAAAIEWALLTLLMASLGLTVILGISSMTSSTISTLSTTPQGAALVSTQAVSGCLEFTNDADLATAQDGEDCYHLLDGPDRFDGSSSPQDLSITTFNNDRFTGSIVTGSGNDDITSRQNGTIATGPGDDFVSLDLTGHPAHSRYSLHLGPGNDTVTLKTGQRPNGSPVNTIFPGPGLTVVSANCATNPLALEPQTGSTLRVIGDCDYRVFGQDLSSVNIEISSATGLSGRLDNINGLSLLAETQINDPDDRSLSITRIQNAKFDIDLASSGSISLNFEDITTDATNDVNLKVKSSGGLLSFSGAAEDDWYVNVDHGPDKGNLSFDFPAEAGFTTMQFPQLFGQTKNLRLAGCFERLDLVLLDQSVLSLDPCPTGTSLPQDLTNVAELRLERDGEIQSINLQKILLQTLQTTSL